MHKSIEKRVLQNNIAGGVSFLFSLLKTFITVPVLLYFLGKEKYGIWLAVFAGFTLLQTFDLGHQNYIGNKLNILFHQNKEELMDNLGASITVAYFIGFIELLICIFLIIFNLLPGYLGISNELSQSLNIAGGLLSLCFMWMLIGSVAGILTRLLIPMGLMHINSWLGILNTIVIFFAMVLVAFLHGGVFELCLSYAVTQFIYSVCVLVYMKYITQEFFPWWQKYDNIKLGLTNLINSLVLTFNGFALQLKNNGIIIVISILFNAATIPLFTTMRTLTNTAGTVTNVFIRSLYPEMIRYHANKQYEKVMSIFTLNWFVSGIIVNFGVVSSLPFIKILYLIWTKNQIEFSYSLFLILSISVSVMNIGTSLNVYLAGINDLKSQTYITTSRIIILSVTVLFLIKNFQLVGIAYSILFSEFVASVVLPIYFVNKYFKVKIRSVLFQLISPLILIISYLNICIFNIDLMMSFYLSFLLLVFVYVYFWFRLDSIVKMKINNVFRLLFFKRNITI